ncbi:hypothetical protein FH972_001852 [Carpinus fangiana]|uniref:Uncharacterized protein n=1 Tax=Carpinus fangiana TaxID=176857 RepID=A0A5N6QDE3_9ROSI|nr:hypothetical protein FH972_001852 [Carpinus fangiana]
MPVPVDASDDREEANGDECKNLVGFQWGFGSIQQQNARIWVFWVVSLDDD